MTNEELKKLGTETRNKNTNNIDTLDTIEMCKLINNEDKGVALAVKKELENISKVIDEVSVHLHDGGRLIYVGAGTSGRIGLIDAVECRPTFSCDDEMVQCVMAGGEGAFVKAKEGAEDSVEDAIIDLKKIGLNKKDILIGIAASGRTPYVLSAIRYANEIGAYSCSIATVKNSLIGKDAKLKIEVEVGPEALTGSTRMKSGTAQKMICNMITTCSMIKLGKVYSNLMVDVKATNEKLKKRAFSIVKEVTNASDDVIKAKLNKFNNAKYAIISILLGLDSEEDIRKVLDQNDNNIRKIIG